MDRKTLLDRAARTAEERLLLAHVLDKCEQSRGRNVPTHTEFLSPAEARSAEDLLHAAAIHDGWALIGGYERAERRMLCFLPDWQDEPDPEEYLAALRVRFRREDALTHRDLLGSLMALGVERARLGDILVSGDAADVIVCAEIKGHLLREWTGAGRAKLAPAPIALAELAVPEQRIREIRDTVATLRLDAVAATGFSMSRARASELIASGRVQLNHRETVKPDAPVREGDVVSARGFGKFTLAEVGGLSRKGRTAILIQRFE
ncbi:MAG: hypothetical protein E7425_02355 [Ruminococcaceae bacterium]|jgi:RNA-binding protein YlmH|nr:hypothetical protein [Oscillospiraceae bacterium]